MMFLDKKELFKILKRSSFFLLLFCFISCNAKKETNEYLLAGRTMGTQYNIKIISGALDNKLLENIKSAVDSSLKNVNQQMSTYIEDSEITLFNNHKDTTLFYISPEFLKVIKQSLEIYNLSNGAFDITVNPLVNLWGFGSKNSPKSIPEEKQINLILENIGSEFLNIINDTAIKKANPKIEIDLSAIAKGYGVDITSDVLDNFSLKNYMVEIGGEIYTKGKNYYNQKWKIGIDKPKYLAMPGNELQDTLNISGVAVATSGDYRNFFEYNDKIYSHTINPRTGKPVTHNLASVTIIAPSCMRADAIATAVLVMGEKKGLKLLESLEAIEGYLILRKNRDEFSYLTTTGFDKYLSLQY